MPFVVVANPKGGVGKSTLATNIAGYWASRGHAVALGDADPQQSARLWLDLRPPIARPIVAWDVGGLAVRPPRECTHAVLDTPAGLRELQLSRLLRAASSVLVPIQASVFDIYATRAFIEQLRELRAHLPLRLGLVGMRIGERTLAAAQLERFLGELEVPVVAELRQTQNYVYLAARGLSVFDVDSSRLQKDLEQWRSLCRWLDADASEAS